jgi:hypothetical protein
VNHIPPIKSTKICNFNSFKGGKELWTIKLTMGKLKPHIVTMVETGMNISDAYVSVIQNAFATHGISAAEIFNLSL